ncbi:MAG TPA: glutaminyl-peptide cyclotransferase [Thermoanaerobaculia bacterium]|jgi:glutaminyl-peptide cyclotransferase
MAALLAALVSLWLLRTPPSSPAPRIAPSAVQAAAAGSPDVPQRLTAKVLSVRPHDPGAYTQGLLLHGGSLFESAGRYGASSLREVDPQTGAVKRQVEVPREYFAEGLALVGDRLIQLTWQEQKAFVYKAADFKPTGEFRYDGEGWGLCWDGRRLVMTDGSDRLTFRDAKTFAVLGEVHVTLAGRSVDRLNELECVDGTVYANVWQTDDILRIDPASGKVTAVVDASGLLTPAERERTDVLNGIAWDPAKKTFLITGKLWPKMFEVTFVPRP